MPRLTWEYFRNSKESSLGFLGSIVVKNPPANTGDISLIPGLEEEDPCGRKWQPIPVFLLVKSHGQRSLVGHCSCSCNESDMTAQGIAKEPSRE